MQSYSITDLTNFHIQQEADESFDTGLLSKESYEKIKTIYTCKLYTPNFFIRIALGLLCIVCITFATALLFLVVHSSSDDIIPVILFLMFIVCYGLLEYLVKQKKYYNAGIDNTLQVLTIIFFAGMFANGDYPYQDVCICAAVLVAAIWLCIIFTDSFMALIAYTAFVTLLCILCKHAGAIFIAYSPFIVMTASALIYVMQRWSASEKRLHFYKKCFDILRIAALTGFYVSCNAYVVTQLSNTVFLENIDPGKTYFILLLLLNIAIPALYIFYGSIKKQLVFLRIGFITLTATIVTIFYFYPFMSGEIWFITGGCIMILAGYTGVRSFKNGKHGFTSNSNRSLQQNLINIQTIISVQASYKGVPGEDIQFGGGSSGGAGASGNW